MIALIMLPEDIPPSKWFTEEEKDYCTLVSTYEPSYSKLKADQQ